MHKFQTYIPDKPPGSQTDIQGTPPASQMDFFLMHHQVVK